MRYVTRTNTLSPNLELHSVLRVRVIIKQLTMTSTLLYVFLLQVVITAVNQVGAKTVNDLVSCNSAAVCAQQVR